MLGANTFTAAPLSVVRQQRHRGRVARVAASPARLSHATSRSSATRCRRDATTPSRARTTLSATQHVRASATGRSPRRRGRLLHDQEATTCPSGRVFTPQEAELGTPVVVIGDEVAKYFFAGLNPIGRELRIGGIPYTVIGVIEHQGNLFGQSLDKTAYRALQLAPAPAHQPARRHRRPHGPGAERRHDGRGDGDGARGDARASPAAPGAAGQLRHGDVRVGARVLREDRRAS